MGQSPNILLSLLPPKEYSVLSKHLKSFSGNSGEVLHEPGENIGHVYFPHSGMISLLAVMENGASIEIATVGNESAMGAVTGAGAKKAITRAVVQIPLVSSRITREQFLACVDGNAVMLRLVDRANEALLGQVQQTAACNALHQVEARLARWLLQSHDRTIGDNVPLTQEFLSQMLGVRRTSVTEFAQSLQNDGLIKYHRGNIEILDRARLEGKACECYGVVAAQTKRLLAEPLTCPVAY